jgi:hypothetical protein
MSNATKAQANRPVHEVRFGAVKAVIWCNQTANGPMHNVTVARVYKDGDEWKQATSFGADDLLPLSKALDMAHTWIHGNKDA